MEQPTCKQRVRQHWNGRKADLDRHITGNYGEDSVSDETWVYVKSEPSLFTVGFYDGDGKWQTDSDHDTREEAAKRVNYLNGGQNPAPALLAQNKRLRDALTIYVNNDDVGARLSTPLYKTARAALNEKE